MALVWPRPWAALWVGLPIKNVVSLPHRADKFLPRSMVPKKLRHTKAPKYRFDASYVLQSS